MAPVFRVYTGHDVAGVEVGAAVKNVIAVASGMARAMELGDNTTAALVSRGLAEIMRLGAKMGAHPLTLAGLAGVGRPCGHMLQLPFQEFPPWDGPWRGKKS